MTDYGAPGIKSAIEFIYSISFDDEKKKLIMENKRLTRVAAMMIECK